MLSPETKMALVIAHPGHELRIFHWLELKRPIVFVLTDGSGRSGQSRLPSTAKILDQVGARKGSFFGRLTDHNAYSAILERETDVFVGLARELAAELNDTRIDYVAGDALQGYNPTHDVCRLIIDAAIAMATRLSGRELGNFDFPLTGRPDTWAAARSGQRIDLELDDAAFARKMATALSYVELDTEVEEAINQNRIDAFRLECLSSVTKSEPGWDEHEKPYYERHGEHQVAAGYYRDVIRYRQHFLPLAEALQRQIDAGL